MCYTYTAGIVKVQRWKRSTGITINMKKSGDVHELYRRFAYSFPLFQSHQQGGHSGASGSLGEEERNIHSGNRGLHASSVAAGA